MQNIPEQNCPICNQNSYDWGYVQGAGEVRYVSNDAGWLEKGFTWGGQAVRARKCNHCGNLQLFAHES